MKSNKTLETIVTSRKNKGEIIYDVKPMDFKKWSISISLGILLSFIYGFSIDKQNQFLFMYFLFIFLSFLLYHFMAILDKTSILNQKELHISNIKPVSTKINNILLVLFISLTIVEIMFNLRLHDSLFLLVNYSDTYLYFLVILIVVSSVINLMNTYIVNNFIKSISTDLETINKEKYIKFINKNKKTNFLTNIKWKRGSKK